MAYESLNVTRKCGVLKSLETKANRPLLSRPPPERWELFYPTEPKRNKRERLNATSNNNTSTALPSLPISSKISADLRITTFAHLPHIMSPISPFINALHINNIVSLSTFSLICANQPYVNHPAVIYLSSTSYSDTDSNTLLPTVSNCLFPSSEQIASDIIHVFIHASPHRSPNRLQLFVLENMLNKHFKQSLISHIDLLLLAFSNRNYLTFESIIRSCIKTFGFR